MEIFLCLVSFVLGWCLSSWSKSHPFTAPAQSAPDMVDLVGKISPPTNVTHQSQPDSQVTAQDPADDQSWCCDFTYLDEHAGESSSELDATLAAQQYFMDTFHDEDLDLNQRLEGLKAAISMDESLLDATVFNQVYSLLQHIDSSENIDDTIYMLHLLEGHIESEKLADLIGYLNADNAQIREEALKTITRADKANVYKRQIETILNDDPQSEVRALAFVLLEQYYSPKAAIAL